MERKFFGISIISLPCKAVQKFFGKYFYSSHRIPQASNHNFWSNRKRPLTLNPRTHKGGGGEVNATSPLRFFFKILSSGFSLHISPFQ